MCPGFDQIRLIWAGLGPTWVGFGNHRHRARLWDATRCRRFHLRLQRDWNGAEQGRAEPGPARDLEMRRCVKQSRLYRCSRLPPCSERPAPGCCWATRRWGLGQVSTQARAGPPDAPNSTHTHTHRVAQSLRRPGRPNLPRTRANHLVDVGPTSVDVDSGPSLAARRKRRASAQSRRGQVRPGGPTQREDEAQRCVAAEKAVLLSTR